MKVESYCLAMCFCLAPVIMGILVKGDNGIVGASTAKKTACLDRMVEAIKRRS
jgi:hypothetical protein